LATVEDSEVAAIVGATVGGVVVLLCLGALLFFAQRRRQRKRAGAGQTVAHGAVARGADSWSAVRGAVAGRQPLTAGRDPATGKRNLSRSTEEWRAESDSGGSRGQRSGSRSDEEAAMRRHSSIPEAEWDKFTLIPWERCSLGGFIGSGTSGDVYSATYASTQVACKLLRKRNINSRDMQLLVEECELGLRLRHPNVLLMIGLTSDRAMNHGILTELLDLSLAELIERRSAPAASTWDFPFASISLDISRGMDYLHEHGVLHRDLKPGNVLLKRPQMTAKVADFGSSRDVLPGGPAGLTEATAMTMTMAGTPLYMAPEVMRQDRYGKPADVWSFGGVLVHIATGQPPLSHLLAALTPVALMHGVAEGDCSPTTGIDELATWPDEIRHLAEACCSPRQHLRPTFAQIAGALAEVSARRRSSQGPCARLGSRQSTVGSDLSRSEHPPHQVEVAPPSYAETGSSAEGSARPSGRLSEMVGKFVGNLFSSGV